MAVVNINDERRQEIALRVNQAVSVRPAHDACSSLGALAQTPAPPIIVNCFITSGEKAQSDFGLIAEECAAHKIPRIVDHCDDCAALEAGRFSHVAAIHPEMSFANALGAACRNLHFRHYSDELTTSRVHELEHRTILLVFALDRAAFSA